MRLTAVGGMSRRRRRRCSVKVAALAIVSTVLRWILPILGSTTSRCHTSCTADTTDNAAIFLVVVIIMIIAAAVAEVGFTLGHECIQRVGQRFAR